MKLTIEHNDGTVQVFHGQIEKQITENDTIHIPYDDGSTRQKLTGTGTLTLIVKFEPNDD